MSGQLDNFAPDVDIEAELAKEPEPVEAVAPEPEPQPEPAEVKAEETPEEVVEEQPKPKRMVDLNALHEARAKERAAKERAAQLEAEYAEKMAKLEKRLELLANPPPPVPKFEDDPANHLKAQLEATRQEIEPVKQQIAQQQEVFRRQQAEAQLTNAVQAAESEFVKAQPDYLEAVAHLQRVADANLQLMGVDDPAERAAAIRRDAMAMAARALQAGRSPAEMAYQLAKNQGYAPKAATNSNSDKIANIQKGQKATPSMPSGGGVKKEGISLEDIANMDDDQFDEMLSDDNWKKLLRTAH